MLKFDKTVSIIVPINNNRGEPTAHNVFENVNALTDLVGGVTGTKTFGEWFEDDGLKYEDPSISYEWFASSDINPHRLYSCLASIVRSLFNDGQLAVTFKLGATAYIIDCNEDVGEIATPLIDYMDGDK